eukprot:5786602-Alexandrium_andersonii.AAC.1
MARLGFDLPYTWEASGDGLLRWVLVGHLLESGTLRPELRTLVSDLWARSRFGLGELRYFA